MIEDDDGHALLIEETLRQYLNIEKAIRVKDGEEALFFLHRKDPRPDLILLDLKIPKIDGYGVLQNLKTDKRFKSIPIVVISSTADQREINYCYQLGVTGYVVKPLNFEELGQKIRGLGQFLSVVSLPEQKTSGPDGFTL